MATLERYPVVKLTVRGGSLLSAKDKAAACHVLIETVKSDDKKLVRGGSTLTKGDAGFGRGRVKFPLGYDSALKQR